MSEAYLIEVDKEKETDLMGKSYFSKLRKDKKYMLSYDDEIEHFIITELKTFNDCKITNLELIKQGKHDGFNNLIANASAEDMADMLSELSCEMCLCRVYCDNTKNGGKSCQSVIKSWLNEEVR